MATTADLKKKYLQMAQNNQAGTSNYLNAQKNQALNQANNVLAQKYSNPTVNPNQSFYNYGGVKQGYNNMQDSELLARYNKAITDYNNYNLAEQNLKQYGQQRQDQERQASLILQQGQKYIPSQLDAMGLGKTGMSETAQTGLMNTYAGIVANANRDYASNVNQMYQDLANANLESNQQLELELSQNREENKYILDNAIQSIDDPELLQKYWDTYGNYADKNTELQYKYKQDVLKDIAAQNYQATVDEILQTRYNIDPTTAVDMQDLKPSQFAFKGSGKNKKQDKLIEMLSYKFDEIPDGTVIDINIGGGTDKYLVFNGKMYKTDKEVTKGYQGQDLYDRLGGDFVESDEKIVSKVSAN